MEKFKSTPRSRIAIPPWCGSGHFSAVFVTPSAVEHADSIKHYHEESVKESVAAKMNLPYKAIETTQQKKGSMNCAFHTATNIRRFVSGQRLNRPLGSLEPNRETVFVLIENGKGKSSLF